MSYVSVYVFVCFFFTDRIVGIIRLRISAAGSPQHDNRASQKLLLLHYTGCYGVVLGQIPDTRCVEVFLYFDNR